MKSHITQRRKELERRIVEDAEYYQRIAELILPRIKTGDPNECWPWTGYVGKNGYGVVNLGIPMTVHRLAWILHNKKAIPGRKHGIHSCDFRRCCNPSHISPGTAKQNMRDCIQKGRFKFLPPPKKGEENPKAKVSNEDARFIAEHFIPYSRGEFSRSALSKKFGISGMGIYRIANGIAWKQIGARLNLTTNGLSKKDTAEVVRRYERQKRSGPNSRSALAKEFGIAAWAISDIIRVHDGKVKRRRKKF